MTPESLLPRLGRLLTIVAAYTAIAALATRPLLAHFTTEIGGTALDPWQTLWGFWWWRHSAAFGSSPMFSKLLWWPAGAPLWFQTWDLPSALAVWPLWGWVSEKAIYNVAVFASFPLSGLAAYALCRELWRDRLAAFLAGCLYTFSTFHFAHAGMELHLASMEWSPLFFLGLVRMCRRQRLADAVLTGLGLGLALLASIYHFVFCIAATVVLAWTGGLGDRRMLWARLRSRPTLVAVAVFLALSGWLIVGMSRSYLHEMYTGGHDPNQFSADVESFVVPNGISVWSRSLTGSLRWTGNEYESAAYIGVIAAGLAVLGVRKIRAARPFLWVALAGAVLALGPRLHVGGVTTLIPLPEFLLEFLVPPFHLSGMPTRFSWLTTFGVAVAAGAGLSWLCSLGRRGQATAVALTALALLEAWPRPFTMTSFPEPAIFSDWAKDTTPWSVVDATDWSRPLWHQMAHHHPIVTGYVTRLPERLLYDVRMTPGLRQFLREPFSREPGPGEPAAQTLRDLHARQVRFVIVDDTHAEVPARLALPERYRGGGIVIFEVPAGF